MNCDKEEIKINMSALTKKYTLYNDHTLPITNINKFN